MSGQEPVDEYPFYPRCRDVGGAAYKVPTMRSIIGRQAEGRMVVLSML